MRRFVSDFLLPVVRGGAVHIARPIGLQAALRMQRELLLLEDAALERLAACRSASATRVASLAVPPPFDETTMRLAAALELASVGAPRSATEAVHRHSLLARLPEIVRVDRTVHFWLGRQTFVGRRVPPRVTALPALRRVRVEQTSRSWLREIGIPVVGRQAFLALNVASPLGEALDPLRLDPPVSWGRILPVLRFPTLARVVAGQAVAIGVDRSGDAL